LAANSGDDDDDDDDDFGGTLFAALEWREIMISSNIRQVLRQEPALASAEFQTQQDIKKPLFGNSDSTRYLVIIDWFQSKPR